MGYSNDPRIVLSTRTEMHHGVPEEVPLRTVSRLCKVISKVPTRPTFTGSHQEAFCGRARSERYDYRTRPFCYLPSVFVTAVNAIVALGQPA
jgi:hypothetical protein